MQGCAEETAGTVPGATHSSGSATSMPVRTTWEEILLSGMTIGFLHLRDNCRTHARQVDNCKLKNHSPVQLADLKDQE